jgi:hypothetical protein
MRIRWVVCLAICGLFCAVPVASAGEATPTLVVRVRSLNDVMEQGQYLATVAGKGQLAKQFIALIKSRIGEEGLEGIDPKRPIGVYATLAANLKDTAPVVMVPVADEKTFLDFLDRLNFSAEKDKEGIYKVKSDQLPVEVYFRLANKYAYVTIRSSDALAKDKLLSPTKIQPGQDVLSASFHIDQVPNQVKALALTLVQHSLEKAENEEKPGETASQKALRLQVLKELNSRLSGLIKDGAELNLGVDINHKTKELSVTASLSGKAKSRLSADIAELAKEKSVFSDLLSSKSVAGVRAHLILPEKVRKSLEPVIDEFIKQTLAKQEDQGAKAVVEKFLKALRPSLVSGELDAGFSLRRTSDKGFMAIAGVKLKDGEALEKVIEEVVPQFPEAIAQKIKLAAATEGETKIHRLDIQESYNDVGKALFGDNPVYVAVRSDALVIGVGAGALDAVKAALKAKPGLAPPVSYEIELAHLLSVLPKDEAASKAAEKAFGKGSPGRLRLTLEGGKTLQVRLVTQLSVVEFFGELVRLKSKKDDD